MQPCFQRSTGESLPHAQPDPQKKKKKKNSPREEQRSIDESHQRKYTHETISTA
jgi:hypothetical protein